MYKYKEIAITYKTLINTTTDTITLFISKKVPFNEDISKTLLPGESMVIYPNTFIRFKSSTKAVYLGSSGDFLLSSRLLFENSGIIAIDTTTPKILEFKEYMSIGDNTNSGTSRLSFNISKGQNMGYCVIGVLNMNTKEVHVLSLEECSGTVQLPIDFANGTPLMLFLFTNNKSPTSSSNIICEQNYFNSFNIEGTSQIYLYTPKPYVQLQIMPGYSTVYFSCTSNRNSTGSSSAISGSGTGSLTTTMIPALLNTIASSDIIYYCMYRYNGSFSILSIADITIHNPRRVIQQCYSEGLSLVWNEGYKEFTKITSWFNLLYPITISYLGGGGNSGSIL